ncbi:unnamed protein product [Mycena citricolor]|uniref:Uncharacterized protein n=1 Tax=Mycena citricolor TaxID=2018698 RepID=A0AAD2HR48_9AGAR|nr:unnamed protein product [Mycena citricolor]
MEECPKCGERRYDANKSGSIAQQTFNTVLLGPQLQALRQSPEASAKLRYRKHIVEEILKDLQTNRGEKTQSYTNFFDGSDFLDALRNGQIGAANFVVGLLLDGAQLYRNKSSDCWIGIWLLFDFSPMVRYKKNHIMPSFVVPGPNKPKNMDSFLFPGLHHIAALQNEAERLKVWDALRPTEPSKTTQPFIAVGDKAVVHTVVWLDNMRFSGSGMYNPALLKLIGYSMRGCNHKDVNLVKLLENCNQDSVRQRYNWNLTLVCSSQNPTQFKKNRLKTGICKPTIMSGVPGDH